MTNKTLIPALMFALPWTVFMMIYNSIMKGGLTLNVFISTLIGGIIAGFTYTWIMQYAAKRLFNKTTVAIAENENSIKEGGANHFKGKEGVGGKLVLTDRRLIFKSHKFNIQNHQDSFDLDQIEKLQATTTFRFLKNGLTLELTNNEQHKFIVDDPTDWVESILNQKRLSH